jgi:hypothetical protein
MVYYLFEKGDSCIGYYAVFIFVVKLIKLKFSTYVVSFYPWQLPKHVVICNMLFVK